MILIKFYTYLIINKIFYMYFVSCIILPCFLNVFFFCGCKIYLVNASLIYVSKLKHCDFLVPF